MKDKGLRKAVRAEGAYKLPSNFAYRTMLRVDQSVLLRERRAERRMLWATIAAALFLLGLCLTSLLVFFRDTLVETLERGAAYKESAFAVRPVPALLFAGLVAILLSFDKWMRTMYFKRHAS